jgi:dTDP-4-amino-4,6-dideoxygalactose transaminase
MIPFVDLKAQYRVLRSEIEAAVKGVLDSGQYILGEEVTGFEREFASYCGGRHAIAVNSGTSALHLALLAAEVGPGHEVITVPFTFVATVAAVGYSGARPVFVDIDPRTLTIDPDRIEAAITPRTRAILPVHLHGRPADLGPIREIARRRGLLVIEDAAQAHGAEYQGKRIGGHGDLTCFSFYPGKNLGAYGEGGAVVTDDPAYDRTIRMLRDWGAERKYLHVLKGFNYRMEGLQGAILRVKLRYLDEWIGARRLRAAQYDRRLVDSPVRTLAAQDPVRGRHAYHVYAVRHPRRDDLQRYLADGGVQTGIHYPIPIHLLPAWSDLGHAAGDFPHAEQAAAEVLSLPMFPELEAEQVEAVCQLIGRFPVDRSPEAFN